MTRVFPDFHLRKMFYEKRRRTETAVVKKKKKIFEGFMLVVGVV